MKKLLIDIWSKALRITAKGKYKITVHHSATGTLHVYGRMSDTCETRVIDCWLELDQKGSLRRAKEVLWLLSDIERGAKTA